MHAPLRLGGQTVWQARSERRALLDCTDGRGLEAQLPDSLGLRSCFSALRLGGTQGELTQCEPERRGISCNLAPRKNARKFRPETWTALCLPCCVSAVLKKLHLSSRLSLLRGFALLLCAVCLRRIEHYEMRGGLPRQYGAYMLCRDIRAIVGTRRQLRGRTTQVPGRIPTTRAPLMQTLGLRTRRCPDASSWPRHWPRARPLPCWGSS